MRGGVSESERERGEKREREREDRIREREKRRGREKRGVQGGGEDRRGRETSGGVTHHGGQSRTSGRGGGGRSISPFAKKLTRAVQLITHASSP